MRSLTRETGRNLRLEVLGIGADRSNNRISMRTSPIRDTMGFDCRQSQPKSVPISLVKDLQPRSAVHYPQESVPTGREPSKADVKALHT